MHFLYKKALIYTYTPHNSQSQKVRFLNIAFSFTSLIPCPIPPRDDREKTEGTPHQLRTSKKALFLR